MQAEQAVQNPTVLAPDVPAPSTSTTESETSPSDRAAAAKFIDEALAHARFTLPATDSHGPLTVSYAIAGDHDGKNGTVLCIGGLMGTRYLATLCHHVAKKSGLRIVVADRPGMGLSSRAEVSQRISIWLETVPALLKELNVKHVSVLAHSCGAVYAINTVYAMPEILPPSNPALYLLAPWVPTKHSGAKLLSAASMLPSPLINQFDSVISFVNSVVAPPLGFSSTALSSFSSMFSFSGGSHAAGDANKPKHERDNLCREFMGVSAAVSAAISDEMMRRIFKEDISGANNEALLCLRKPNTGSYQVLEDYVALPGKLDERMKEQFWHGESTLAEEGMPSTEAQPQSERPQFLVRAFWGVTDMMIGKGGEEYFEKCFKDYLGSAGEHCLTYQGETVPETDHEALLRPQYGVLSTVFEDIVSKT